MSSEIAVYFDPSIGALRRFAAADVLLIDDIDRLAGSGHMTIGASLGAAEELQLGSAASDVRVLGDLLVDGSSTVSVDETITGSFTANGDVNLGNNSGDTIDLGGGTNDTVGLNTDLTVGNNALGIGSSATDALDELWLSTVVGGAGTGINLRATGNGTSGSEAIGVYITPLTNSTPGASDLQTVLEALDAAIGAASGTLQQAYEAGNTISVTTAEGAVTISNSTDTTNTLSVARTNTGAGVGIGVSMGAATTGVGLSLSNAVGATGDLLYINNFGSGNSLRIADAGNDLFTIDATGAVNLGYAGGASTTITGTTVNMNPSSTITMQPSGDIDMIVTGANGITMTNASTPTATLLELTNTGTGKALDVITASVSVIQVFSAGGFSIHGATDQSADVQVAGTGVLTIGSTAGNTMTFSNAGVTGSFNNPFTFNSSSTLALNFAGQITIDSTGNELKFDDVGNSGLTLSQSSDRTLSQTGTGEILNGVTSIVGAINALAEFLDVEGGSIVELVAGTGGFTAGDVAAQDSTSGQAVQWNGNANTNSKFIGVALNTVAATGTVRIALPGSVVTDAGATFTPGAALFGPDGTGRPTATPPSGAGDAVKRIGFALTATSYIIETGPTVII